jgi:hypothetical protein
LIGFAWLLRFSGRGFLSRGYDIQQHSIVGIEISSDSVTDLIGGHD